MRREGDGGEEGGGGVENKGKGGGDGYHVQTLLERNADWSQNKKQVYGAAAFFVALAFFILLFTPASIEVDAAGNPTHHTTIKHNLPSEFKVKLSKMAHTLKETFSHVDWTPHSELNDLDGSLVGSALMAPSDKGRISAGRQIAEGADVLALKEEVAVLTDKVGRLESALQRTTCSMIMAARTGMCTPPRVMAEEEQEDEKLRLAASKSTQSAAVLRPAGYTRQHKRWTEAKDHWASNTLDFETPRKQTLGFKINTHNPESEDLFISRAVHARQIWDKPVFDVFKHVLVTKGLPPSRVLDVGGNIGYFSLWALAMGHKVTTFEPMDFNLRYIVSSIEANKFGANHTLYQNAVGNQGGRVELLPTNKRNRGNYQVQAGKTGTRRGGGEEYGMDYVDTVRLDDVVDEDVLLVKIDVEGFEHKVLDGARRLICSRLVRYIEFEFTTSKTDLECNAEQVLCWLDTVGYVLTGVEDVREADSQLLRPLNVHAWATFPTEVLATLRDPLLPPGLLLEASGMWNNPCRELTPPIPDPHWRPYKLRWCAHKFASYSNGFVPCKEWGAVPAEQQRVWSALACDALLGFDCSSMTVDRKALVAVTSTHPYSEALASSTDPAHKVAAGWLDEWRSSYQHYYHTHAAS